MRRYGTFGKARVAFKEVYEILFYQASALTRPPAREQFMRSTRDYPPTTKAANGRPAPGLPGVAGDGDV